MKKAGSCFELCYSALIWQSFILYSNWQFEIKWQILKPPNINAHAHSNAHVHQIAKLKTLKYIFMRKLPK